MTERDYIIVSDLAIVRSALRVITMCSTTREIGIAVGQLKRLESKLDKNLRMALDEDEILPNETT